MRNLFREILLNILLEEKADRCKLKADQVYDKPSAYKSGAIVRCRKGDIWKPVKEEADFSKEKEQGLHGWFSRKGGKSKGWVDCNTCKTDAKTGKKKCKSCGREAGEKRAKYPACRPTPAQCKTPGKGDKWGKKSES